MLSRCCCSFAAVFTPSSAPPPQIRALDSHKLAACAGPQADCAQFVEYVQRNVALNEFRTGLKMSTRSVASFVRAELAAALRKNPYQVNLLIGGSDAGAAARAAGLGAGGAHTPSLYFIDYLGSSAAMDFAAHGYAGYFLYSTLDRHWRAGLNIEDALALARVCVKELATRFLLHQPNFTVKVADKDGVRELKL